MCYPRVIVKRLYAIVFLGIFLLNMLGYYGVLVGLKAHAGEEFSARAKSDMYDLGSALTLRIPITIPYAVNSQEYVPAEGKFEHEGEVYHLLKQRFHQDTLYVVCAKDLGSTELTKTIFDYVQGFTDSPDDGSQNTAPQGLIKDFISQQIGVTSHESGWSFDIVVPSASRTFTDSFFGSVVHPPERA